MWLWWMLCRIEMTRKVGYSEVGGKQESERVCDKEVFSVFGEGSVVIKPISVLLLNMSPKKEVGELL